MIDAGSRPISAQRRSSSALRPAASSMSPPGMFHTSACSAATRSTRAVRPADDDRRVRALDGLGVAERTGEVEVGAVEVERLGLGPQPADDRAGLGEALHGVVEVVEGQAVRVVLAPGQRVAGARARADAEVEPAAGDDVDGRGDLGQHRGRPEAVARHEQPEAQPVRLRGEGGEQGPALEDRPVRVAADRHEVVEQPGVLDLGDRVRLVPHAQDVVVADLLGGGHDPEARRLRHRRRDAASSADVLVRRGEILSGRERIAVVG